MTTPHTSDDAPNGDHPMYVRGTPEYHAEWLRVRAARQQLQRERARLSRQTKRAAQKPPPPEETPGQHTERMRIVAERRARINERHRRYYRGKAEQERLHREAAS